MKKFTLIALSFFFTLLSFAQDSEQEKIKYHKLTYNDFKKLSINDTSSAVIDLFFEKKDNALFNQMSLLPVSAVIAIVPPLRVFGMGAALVTTPLFINGSYMLVKYRKKKLYNVLTEYEKTGELPEWVRRKTNRKLKNYELLPINY